MVNAANESLLLKDAEIARLQARISGMERTMASYRSMDSFGGNMGSNSVYQSSALISPQTELNEIDEINDIKESNSDGVLPETVPSSENQFNSEYSSSIQTFKVRASNFQKVQPNVDANGQPRTNQGQFDGHRQNEEQLNLVNQQHVLQVNNNTNKHFRDPNQNGVAMTTLKHTNNSADSTSDKQKHQIKKSSPGQNSHKLRHVTPKSRPRKSDHLPGEYEIEPVTAVGMYQPNVVSEVNQPEEQQYDDCDSYLMEEIQEKIRENELRQQMIDQQLMDLDNK